MVSPLLETPEVVFSPLFLDQTTHSSSYYMTRSQMGTIVNEMIHSSSYQNSYSNRIIRATLLCHGKAICSEDDLLVDDYQQERTRQSSSNLAYFIQYDIRGFCVNVILYTLAAWILGQATLHFLLRVTTLLCSPSSSLSCMQSVKVLFSELDASYNPLSLTRAIFKKHLRHYELDMAELKQKNAQLVLITQGLSAQCRLLNDKLTNHEATTSKTGILRTENSEEKQGEASMLNLLTPRLAKNLPRRKSVSFGQTVSTILNTAGLPLLDGVDLQTNTIAEPREGPEVHHDPIYETVISPARSVTMGDVHFTGPVLPLDN